MSGGDSQGQNDIKTLGGKVGTGLLSQFDKGIPVNNVNLFSGMGAQTKAGLDQLRAATFKPNSVDEATRSNTGILNGNGYSGGMAGDARTYDQIGGQYAQLYGQQGGPGLMERNMLDTANGANLGGKNPHLNQVLDNASADTATDVNGQFMGAGRFGADAHAGELAKQIGNIRTSALNQNYETERDRQLQAIQGIGNERQTTLGNQQGLLAGRAGVTGAGAGLDQQAIGNRFTAQGMAPGLLSASLLPAQTRVGIGQARDANQQGLLTGRNDLFNRQQGAGFDNIQRILGLLNQTGGTPGLQKETPWWQSLVGLGLQAL